MQHPYQWTGQTEASGYIHKQSAEAHEHGNSMHYTNAEFLPILSTRNWTVPNCLWGQIIQVANLYSHYSTDAHSVTSQLPPEDLSGTTQHFIVFSVFLAYVCFFYFLANYSPNLYVLSFRVVTGCFTPTNMLNFSSLRKRLQNKKQELHIELNFAQCSGLNQELLLSLRLHLIRSKHLRSLTV